MVIKYNFYVKKITLPSIIKVLASKVILFIVVLISLRLLLEVQRYGKLLERRPNHLKHR